ncbi:MAG: TfoX/Sxy family DNA transformation protein, partial [Burkholderiales bacterium]|nr:TfoX/Sxy family DNA transformation protein [Burkholderiales bacterium]
MINMSAPTSLKDLPGLGPASQKMLEQAGITSVAQLQMYAS